MPCGNTGEAEALINDADALSMFMFPDADLPFSAYGLDSYISAWYPLPEIGPHNSSSGQPKA